MELKFDFATDDTKAGFRLAYFEAYNWGTYNKKIVTLQMQSENALLTGDIGSGKSTIVDALTTLLVPHQKIVYNKAAGADTKERTLYSYVVGEYKSAQDEEFGSAKAIALRDSANYSVILGRFENEGFAEHLILAQFFYLLNNQVHKFFVVSQGELQIKKDFFHFSDIRALKKRLKNSPHTSVYDSFKEYSKDFRRVMGIKNEQALNLFYQTVSLKSIGNLTQFIRTHMLESSAIEKHIDELCSNFAELNHTHELVLKAKHQLELLNPIKKESKRYQGMLLEQAQTERLKQKLGLYFAYEKEQLLSAKIEELQLELTKKHSSKKELHEEVENIAQKLSDLKMELKANGGDRIDQIKREIKFLSQNLQTAKLQNQNYNKIIKSLGYQAVSNEHRFLLTLDAMKKEFDAIEEEQVSLENSIMFDKNSQIAYQNALSELEVEISYLKNNPSNIPQRVSKIRENLANALNLSSEALPFVGELITVKDEKWSGAIERVLHNFALSLIVESSYYDAVSEYVENTHLQGKLVYLKVDSMKQVDRFVPIETNSLLEKIELKVDSPFYEWLNGEMQQRFNIVCVEEMASFRRFKKALSIHGQFKSNFSRHEKDDRYDVNDRSRWVLGWDNFIKLEALEKEQTKQTQKLAMVKNALKKNILRKKEILEKRDHLRDALKFEIFDTINWYKYSKEIESLEEEKQALENATDILKKLQESIEENEQILKNLKSKYEDVLSEIGRLGHVIEMRTEELNSAKLLISNGELDEEIALKLERLKNELIDTKLNLNNMHQSQNRIKERLESIVYGLTKKINRSTTKIITDMGHFINAYPSESKEFDATINSIDDFNTKFEQLKKDNLPKWQKKFKELLKEKTIQGVVILQSELDYQSKQIVDKIRKINQSLQDIEYSDGTFIELIAEKSKNSEIKDFKQKLKLVTTGSITEDNSYDEQKFLAIKEIISRFNGREGHIDVDKKWKNIVTDVRNWFDFSASEKYMSDGTQKEYYAHSGGKSGGQKEKLAYTVLASSLAYQFGLEYDKIQSRSFRFVMIDEAFGRGSDESTRYALKLFEKLRLQLLVITPKQKINVIEPHVSSVHFVHNQDGMDSSLISMTIQEYQKNKSNA